jgi:ABC-2 type transport system ATP-binding protein
VIVCESITKRYRSQHVLQSIDLQVAPGITALLGANGAGKSTLLRLLSGLEKPDTGTVLIDGMTFSSDSIAIRKNLGVLPEGLGLFESLTVLENLMAVGPIYGLTPTETAARSADLLTLLDLTRGRHTPARQCSFGMRKKTALALALLHDPRILLLDEPFEGIDPASSSVIQALLQQLSAAGATILLTSHILPIVQQIATRVIVLHRGQIAEDLTPSNGPAAVERLYFNIVGRPQPEVPGWLSS